MSNLEGKLKKVRSSLFVWEAPDREGPARLLTEDGRIEDVGLAVGKGCMESPVNGIYQAWQLDSSNMTKDPERGLTQVLCERDWAAIPLWHPNDAKWSKAEVSKIAKENLEQAKTQTTRKNNRDMALYIVMAIAILIVIATLFVLATNRIDWGATWNMMTSAFSGGKK